MSEDDVFFKKGGRRQQEIDFDIAYEKGQASCAAGPWSYNFNEAPLKETFFMALFTYDQGIIYQPFRLTEEHNRESVARLVPKSYKRLGWAKINLLEEEE